MDFFLNGKVSGSGILLVSIYRYRSRLALFIDRTAFVVVLLLFIHCLNMKCGEEMRGREGVYE